MGWETIKLNEVDITPEAITDGSYKLRVLPGASYDERNPNQLNMSVAIEEGKFAGRRLFVSYPDPDRFDWAPKALKKLEIALGTDSMAGEDPTAYLNRVATNGHASFQAVIKNDTYIDKNTNTERSKAKMQLFSVGPAA